MIDRGKYKTFQMEAQPVAMKCVFTLIGTSFYNALSWTCSRKQAAAPSPGIEQRAYHAA